MNLVSCDRLRKNMLILRMDLTKACLHYSKTIGQFNQLNKTSSKLSFLEPKK